jgi:hypothetical protein
MSHDGAIAALATVLTLVITGCQHAPAAIPPTPDSAIVHQCGGAVFRTSLAPDTVAVHFVRAFTTLGLRGATWLQRADTIWVHSNPTPLGSAYGGGVYQAGVVGFRHGDSTYFRHSLIAAAPASGWPAPYDSLTPGDRQVTLTPANSWIGLCGRLGQAAQVHGTAPRDPDGQETLKVWQSWRNVP